MSVYLQLALWKSAKDNLFSRNQLKFYFSEAYRCPRQPLYSYREDFFLKYRNKCLEYLKTILLCFLNFIRFQLLFLFLMLYVELQLHDNSQHIPEFEIFFCQLQARLLASSHFSRSRQQRLIWVLNIMCASFCHLQTKICENLGIFRRSWLRVTFVDLVDYQLHDLFFKTWPEQQICSKLI